MRHAAGGSTRSEPAAAPTGTDPTRPGDPGSRPPLLAAGRRGDGRDGLQSAGPAGERTDRWPSPDRRRAVDHRRAAWPAGHRRRRRESARRDAAVMSGERAASPATGSVDPVTLAVIRSAIYSIAEEMRVIVMRSARSPLLKEAGDLSCVLTDAQGRMIAQGNQDIPIHLGVMGFTVKEFLKRHPAETLRDGDVFYT